MWTNVQSLGHLNPLTRGLRLGVPQLKARFLLHMTSSRVAIPVLRTLAHLLQLPERADVKQDAAAKEDT